MSEEQDFEEKYGVYGHAWRDSPPLDFLRLERLLEADAATQEEFFVVLDEERHRINAVFLKLARDAVRRCDRRGQKSSDWVVPWKALFLKASRKWRRPSIAPHTYSLARICNEYARTNARSLLTILNKCDASMGNTKGADYWTSLWKNQSNEVAFLHSPLRVRVDAIESLEAIEAETLSPEDAASMPFHPVLRLSKTDTQCPICLDALYRPVVLSCGHVYCLPCLLEACHLGTAVGTVRALMSNIRPEEPCCKCRQRNVYKHATIVPELEEYVRKRCPGAWEERDRSEKQKTAEKIRKLSQQRAQKARLAGRFLPMDLLE